MTEYLEKVAAVVLRGGLLLVVRKRGTSIFISPGGKPEPCETDQDALARELREETGLVPRTARPWGAYTSGSALEASAAVRIRAYLVEADGTARAGEEIEEVAWIDAGYRADGVELGSVFGEHVVPELVARGLLRQRRPRQLVHDADTVLVADLDGTLAFGGRPPGPAVSAALAGIAHLDGVRLVLATSRAPRGVRALVGPLTDRLELLCCNGAIHVVNGAVRRRVVLPVPELRSLADHLDAEGIGFCLEYGDRFQIRGGGFPWMAYPDRIDLTADEEPEWQGVVKLAIEEPEPWHLLDRLRGLVTGLELCPHADGVLDVMPADVTKAAALAGIANLDRFRVVAFGNDLNDQALLGRADCAVIVGDGLPGLEHAAHVSRVVADDEAVAGALREAVGLKAAGSGVR